MSTKLTRTGKPVFDPNGSALYAINPCPPACALPKKFSFIEVASGHKLYEVASNNKLLKWATQSEQLRDMVMYGQREGEASLYFIKKAAGQGVLEVNSTLVVQANKAASEETLMTTVLALGASGSGPKARCVQWALLTAPVAGSY